MLPHDSQGQVSNPASLPPVQNAALPTQQQSSVSTPQSLSSSATQSTADTTATIAQAKVLVERYQNNPYQLSIALQQLKAQHLAEQFHINAKPGKY